MKMHPFSTLLPVEVAQRRAMAAARPVTRTERVGLGEGLGRVMAVDCRAPRSVPEFPRATWDGYAFRSRESRGASRESPTTFRVVGDVFAEAGYEGPLGSGEAVAIATGGRVPKGADAVVIFEETTVRGDRLSVPRFVRRGDRIAFPGDDFRRGDELVRKGEVLGAAELGALASAGLDEARVLARPRVAILPNGNELVVPGKRLGRGQIYESNNFTLSAVVRAAGGVPEPHPPLSDHPKRIEQAIRAALRTSDLVVLTGGSSVGERDYLPAIFPRLGRMLFHGIAVRPGKPTLAALSGGTLVLGMPGHPTSCLANGFWLLFPLVRKLAGLPTPGWTDVPATLTVDYMPPSPDLATVVPLEIRGRRGVPTFRDSSAITSLRAATAFAIVPPRHHLARGTRLVAHRLPAPLVAG